MATVDEIIADVVDIIKDDSYSSSDVLRRMNKCLTLIARELAISDYEAVATVVTDVISNTVTLPPDFHFNLFDCRSDTHNRQIRVLDSRRLIDRQLYRLDTGGSVFLVAQSGRNLYYQRRPAVAETLRLFYYRIPDQLVEGGEMPVYIPLDMQESLFTNFACWELFSRIEDGVEGDKINTIHYKKEFYEALGEAVVFFKPEPKSPRGFGDELHMNGLY